MHPYRSESGTLDHGHQHINMTLENCKRLLKHYESLGKTAWAADMKAAIARKGTQPEQAKPAKSSKKDK